MANPFNLGIDASNIGPGGGLTHLSCLLGAAAPEKFRIRKIIVWGGKSTLAALPEMTWLEKAPVPTLDSGLPARVLWQQFALPGLVKQRNCALLFSPGGTIPAASPVPVLTMSQNLLPFEEAEYSRYPLLSLFRLKLALLKRAQSYSMRRAKGVIFLSAYARAAILPLLSGRGCRTAVIPHGLEQRFFCEPRPARPIDSCSAARPFRIIYVSAIDNYKHQAEAATAVAAIKAKGLPVTLEFFGTPLRQPYVKELISVIRRLDPQGGFLLYKGGVDFKELHRVYRDADLFLFASSCENLPNILLEAMASGLPVACSDRGPMPEVLGEAGEYFNPEVPASIEAALMSLIADPRLRERLAAAAYARAGAYSWEKCAEETFAFIEALAAS